MGGEKWPFTTMSAAMPGSPPHGRGKGVDRKIALLRYGITPAQAGKSAGRSRPRLPGRDHPRIGGEKASWAHSAGRMTGSPPHRRGKVWDGSSVRNKRGITPAQAGKSPRRFYAGHGYWDHPRIGGEKASWAHSAGRMTGSPPHRRGKGRYLNTIVFHVGITPA